MIATDSSRVAQLSSSTSKHLLPPHSLLKETSSFAIHSQQILYLALFCLCMATIYFLYSKRRSSNNAQNATQSDISTSIKTKNQILVGPGEWLRPLGSMETYMLIAGKYGSFNTVQAIWLSSVHPINPTNVHQALLHVAEKTHLLQICVQRRGLRPWFRRMKEVVCDFDVQEGDVMTVFYSQIPLSYDMANGPLWRARLVTIPQQSADNPHQACLILSTQHCIVDGYTNMRIFRDIMELLNASITGKIHKVPLRPVIPPASDSLKIKGNWYFMLTYFCTRFYNGLITRSSDVYFKGVLKPPQTRIAQTKILRENFSPEETKELIRFCKEAGVTVNSCIMAIANLALSQTVHQRSNYTVEASRIFNVNSVDMRRYFPDEIKESLGCHISVDEKEFLIQSSAANSKENFWSLVSEFQNHMNDSLHVNYTPIRLAPLSKSAAILLHFNYNLTRRGLKNVTDHHIQSTNMGNLQDLLPAKYDGPVEVTDLLRSGSGELSGNPFTLAFHTLNDRFMIAVNYFTNKITDEDAKLFYSILIQYIENLVRYGTVKEPLSSLHNHSPHSNEEKLESATSISILPRVNDTEFNSDVRGQILQKNVKPSVKIDVMLGIHNANHGATNGNGDVNSSLN